VALSAAETNFVRLTTAAGVCVADAVYVKSSARFNNGQAAGQVRLQPMDGIVLARTQAAGGRPRFSQAAISGANVLLTVTGLTPGFTHELHRSSSLAPADWALCASFIPTEQTATIASPATNSGAFYRLFVP
jgi:hypothetical protein